LQQAQLGGLGGAEFQAFRAQESARQQIPKIFGQQSEDDIVKDVRNKNLPILQSQGKVAYLDAIIADFAARGLGNKAFLAQQLKDQVADAEQKRMADLGLTAAQTTQAYAAAEKSGQEKIPAALEQADRSRLAELKRIYGDVEGARRFREERDAAGRAQAAAGVPESGQVKVSEIASADRLVGSYINAPKAKLDTVRDVRTQLNLVKKGEGAALPQLQRQLIKLVGDNQIAQGEVRAALGSAGIVGDTINAVNQFMVGTPTAEKLDSVEKVINAFEQINAESYNRGRNRAATVLKEAKLSPETQKSLIPPEYKLGGKKQSAFVEGKIYKDANGNRARYVNGKWEPVQ
jgi:hypothetical protein